MAISVVARYEDPRWYNLYFGPRGGHSFPENERPFELPRQYRDKKRRRRSTLFLRFHESDLLRAQTSLLLAWLLWLFPCLAGERKKKGFPGNVLECFVVVPAMPTRRFRFDSLLLVLYISSSSLSCSPRSGFSLSPCNQEINYCQLDRWLLLGIVSRPDFLRMIDRRINLIIVFFWFSTSDVFLNI